MLYGNKTLLSTALLDVKFRIIFYVYNGISKLKYLGRV